MTREQIHEQMDIAAANWRVAYADGDTVGMRKWRARTKSLIMMALRT